MLPCILTPPAKSLSYHNPRIVVAKYARIFLITLRIGRNLPILRHISRKGRVIQNDSVLTVKQFLYTVQCLGAQTLLSTDSGHRAPALALNENPGLITPGRTDLPSEIIVCTQKPAPVPAIFPHGLLHRSHIRTDT